jgi:hypothetical protein
VAGLAQRLEILDIKSERIAVAGERYYVVNMFGRNHPVVLLETVLTQVAVSLERLRTHALPIASIAALSRVTSIPVVAHFFGVKLAETSDDMFSAASWIGAAS